MARPKNADGQRTRQAILDAALDLFAEKGYFGTSLRDVAAAVGVRESALYNYFRNKEALFDALITAHQDEKRERLAPLEEGAPADAPALLEQYALATLDGFTDPREQKFFRILMSDGIRLAREGRINLHERMGAGRERLHDVLRRLIRQSVLRAGDIHVLAFAFVGPLMMWRQLHAVDPGLAAVADRQTFARQHVAQFLQGALAPPAAPRRLAPVRSAVRSHRVS
jgi:AcrR family transcriptional regulator